MKKIITFLLLVGVPIMMFGQVDWTKLRKYHTNLPFNTCTSDEHDVFIQMNEATYTLNEGLSTFFSNTNIQFKGSGPVGEEYKDGQFNALQIRNNEILESNNDGCFQATLAGDTLLFNNLNGHFVKISDGIIIKLMNRIDNSKGYKKVYNIVSIFETGSNGTNIYRFNLENIESIQNLETIIEEGTSTENISFLNEFQVKYKIGNDAGYYFYDREECQLIDPSIFDGKQYYQSVLSYDENNSLIITFTNKYTGDMLQVYLDNNITTSITSSQNIFKIFPNPAKDNIKINTDETIIEINVFNTIGKLILQQKNSYNKNINISNFDNGIYLVQIKTEKGIFIRKIIKK